MTIITLPTTLPLGQNSGVGQRRFDLFSQSESSGSQQTRLLGPPRWTLRLVQPAILNLTDGGTWAALLMQLRGRVNVLAAWDPARPAPRGTLRGTLTLSATAAAGATSISITGGSGQAGRTLLAGDWLTIGTGLGASQLVMATAPVTMDGAGTGAVAFEPPLRAGFASATEVTWDKSLAYYRQQTDASTWGYDGGGMFVTGLSIDLMEVWA